MNKNVLALIAGAAALCMMTAGCSSQTADNTTATATEAATSAAAATTAAAAAAEEEPGWQDDDMAYLSGIKASDYVELPDGYKHQEVEAAKPKDPTDEDVEKRIEAVLQSNGTLEEVDRKVEEWDTVNIDYVGKIDGKEFEGGSGNYDLVIGSGAFIEGFEDGLIGAKKGEKLDLNLKFPENYPAADVAGKDVVFTVTVNKISDYKLTDDFVKSLNLTNAFGQAVTDVSTFQEYVRSNMIEENEAAYTWTVRHQIDNKLLEICTFKQDIPENMLESYYFQYQNYLNNAASASYMDLPTYMQRQYGATQDNYETMIHDFAKQGAQLGIIYQAIADERELNPTAEEIQGAIGEYVKADTTGLKADDLDRFIKEYIRDELVSNRVRSWLYENCKVTEPEDDSEEKSDEDASASETSEENTEDASAGNSSSDNADDNAENADTGSSAEDSGEGQTADSAAAHEN